MVPEARPPQDEATTQTLNYALGNLGGRQKSWMILPSSAAASSPIAPAELTTNPLPFTVRGRGRRRKNAAPLPKRPPQPQAPAEPTLLPQPNPEPQSELLPPSSSTSPQLANVVDRPSNVSHGPSAVTVFPSPTPSEENAGSAAATPQNAGGNTTLFDSDSLAMGTANGNHTPGTPLETVFMDSVRRESALWKRPLEAQALRAEKRSRVEHLEQEQPASRGSTTGAPSPVVSGFPHHELSRRASVQQLQTGSPRLGQLNSRSPSLGHVSTGKMRSPQVAQGMQFRELQATRTPPQPQAPFATTRTSPAGPIHHSHSMPIPTTQDSSHRRISLEQRLATPPPKTWYTMQDCLNALDKFQVANPVSPDHPRDGRRLAVLREATEHQDWPYLTMHQYYCMLSSCPEAVPAHIRKLPTLHHALRVMQDVLDSNETLSPVVLRFFSNYPYSMCASGEMWPPTFEHQSQLFVMFVVYSPNYDQLKQICERRRCPPLARELALDIQIASTTFQRLLFTAFLRSIWRAVPQNPTQARFEADAIAVFRQNQRDYHQRQSDSVQPQYVAQEREREFQLWGSKLKGLVEGFEATLQAQNTSLAAQNIGVPQQRPLPAYPCLHPQPQQPQLDPFSRVAYPIEMPPRQNRAVNPQSAQAAVQQSRGRGHPPTRPAQLTQTVPPLQVPPARQQQQGRKSFLPPAGWNQPQQRIPNPARFSLHQAHLQSPVLRATSVSSPLYTFHEGYIKPPTRLIGPWRMMEKWTFTLSPGEMQTIPQTVRTALVTPGAPGLRNVNEQSKIVRLRSVKWPESNVLDEHGWATADTSWIPHSYFTLNGTSLEQRKKVHYGKDLPIDITGQLVEGENVLEFAVMAPAGSTPYLNYFLAIETIGVSSHKSIKKHCLEQNHAPAEQVLQSIKNKLSGTGDDDEISIVESTLTIGLFDPFSQAKFCDIPVRSRACLHNDCFDLETFLTSRTRKGDTSVADQWKCPICNSDARPHMLLVDGFLEDVKRQLEAQGLSHIRQIIVQQDGSWKPKAEVREGVSDDPPTPTIDRVGMGRSSVSQRASLPADAEVIDLSD
jgi:hypothetical protein